MRQWIEGAANAIGPPLTIDDLDSILGELWPDVVTEPLTVIVSLQTRDRIMVAMEVWRKRQAAIDLRATVYRMNAGNRRRQQRRGK